MAEAGADEAGEARLAAAVGRLYAVPLADFMATRTSLVAQAKADKDKALAARLGKLRKPSVAAWTLNQLVRARPDLVEEIESVGAQLRAAQANLHGTAITALRPARDQLIADVLAGAGEISAGGGSSLSGPAADEIRDSVIAALASAEASEAVTSGALTRSLHYSGFGEVDLEDAVVATTTGRLLRLIRTSEVADDEQPGEAETGAEPEPEGDEPEPEPEAEPEGDEPEDEDEPEPEGDEPEPEPKEEEPEPEPEDEPEEEPEDEDESDEEPEPEDEPEPEPEEEGDPEALIEEAAQAYAQAAAEVARAKAAVRESSERLDAIKGRIAELGAELARAEAESEELFAADAQAREAMAAAVKTRQAAAELLAKREADG